MLHPIMEWGQPLPNDELELIPPHPFQRNSLLGAYPSILDLVDDSRQNLMIQKYLFLGKDVSMEDCKKGPTMFFFGFISFTISFLIGATGKTLASTCYQII